MSDDINKTEEINKDALIHQEGLPFIHSTFSNAVLPDKSANYMSSNTPDKLRSLMAVERDDLALGSVVKNGGTMMEALVSNVYSGVSEQVNREISLLTSMAGNVALGSLPLSDKQLASYLKGNELLSVLTPLKKDSPDVAEIKRGAMEMQSFHEKVLGELRPLDFSVMNASSIKEQVNGYVSDAYRDKFNEMVDREFDADNVQYRTEYINHVHTSLVRSALEQSELENYGVIFPKNKSLSYESILGSGKYDYIDHNVTFGANDYNLDTIRSRHTSLADISKNIVKYQKKDMQNDVLERVLGLPKGKGDFERLNYYKKGVQSFYAKDEKQLTEMKANVDSLGKIADMTNSNGEECQAYFTAKAEYDRAMFSYVAGYEYFSDLKKSLNLGDYNVDGSTNVIDSSRSLVKHGSVIDGTIKSSAILDTRTGTPITPEQYENAQSNHYNSAGEIYQEIGRIPHLEHKLEKECRKDGNLGLVNSLIENGHKAGLTKIVICHEANLPTLVEFVEELAKMDTPMKRERSEANKDVILTLGALGQLKINGSMVTTNESLNIVMDHRKEAMWHEVVHALDGLNEDYYNSAEREEFAAKMRAHIEPTLNVPTPPKQNGTPDYGAHDSRVSYLLSTVEIIARMGEIKWMMDKHGYQAGDTGRDILQRAAVSQKETAFKANLMSDVSYTKFSTNDKENVYGLVENMDADLMAYIHEHYEKHLFSTKPNAELTIGNLPLKSEQEYTSLSTSVPKTQQLEGFHGFELLRSYSKGNICNPVSILEQSKVAAKALGFEPYEKYGKNSFYATALQYATETGVSTKGKNRYIANEEGTASANSNPASYVVASEINSLLAKEIKTMLADKSLSESERNKFTGEYLDAVIKSKSLLNTHAGVAVLLENSAAVKGEAGLSLVNRLSDVLRLDEFDTLMDDGLTPEQITERYDMSYGATSGSLRKEGDAHYDQSAHDLDRVIAKLPASAADDLANVTFNKEAGRPLYLESSPDAINHLSHSALHVSDQSRGLHYGAMGVIMPELLSQAGNMAGIKEVLSGLSNASLAAVRYSEYNANSPMPRGNGVAVESNIAPFASAAAHYMSRKSTTLSYNRTTPMRHNTGLDMVAPTISETGMKGALAAASNIASEFMQKKGGGLSVPNAVIPLAGAVALKEGVSSRTGLRRSYMWDELQSKSLFFNDPKLDGVEINTANSLQDNIVKLAWVETIERICRDNVEEFVADKLLDLENAINVNNVAYGKMVGNSFLGSYYELDEGNRPSAVLKQVEMGQLLRHLSPELSPEALNVIEKAGFSTAPLALGSHNVAKEDMNYIVSKNLQLTNDVISEIQKGVEGGDLTHSEIEGKISQYHEEADLNVERIADTGATAVTSALYEHHKEQIRGDWNASTDLVKSQASHFDEAVKPLLEQLLENSNTIDEAPELDLETKIAIANDAAKDAETCMNETVWLTLECSQYTQASMRKINSINTETLQYKVDALEQEADAFASTSAKCIENINEAADFDDTHLPRPKINSLEELRITSVAAIEREVGIVRDLQLGLMLNRQNNQTIKPVEPAVATPSPAVATPSPTVAAPRNIAPTEGVTLQVANRAIVALRDYKVTDDASSSVFVKKAEAINKQVEGLQGRVEHFSAKNESKDGAVKSLFAKCRETKTYDGDDLRSVNLATAQAEREEKVNVAVNESVALAKGLQTNVLNTSNQSLKLSTDFVGGRFGSICKTIEVAQNKLANKSEPLSVDEAKFMEDAKAAITNVAAIARDVNWCVDNTLQRTTEFNNTLNSYEAFTGRLAEKAVAYHQSVGVEYDKLMQLSGAMLGVNDLAEAQADTMDGFAVRDLAGRIMGDVYIGLKQPTLITVKEINGNLGLSFSVQDSGKIQNVVCDSGMDIGNATEVVQDRVYSEGGVTMSSDNIVPITAEVQAPQKEREDDFSIKIDF